MESLAYYRVSTQQQGVSGLGLAAQKEIVQRFLGNTAPIAEFVEVESGKQHKNRPQLQAALELCRKKKARLVIAKLDRLARNVAFISALMESEVDFVCCDNPHANRLMLHIMAAFAEHERDIISERIKATKRRIKSELAAKGFRISHAGRRYTRLGSPDIEAARLRAWEARRGLMPPEQTLDFMHDLRASGASFRRIAEELNRWQLRTGHGNAWYASTVRTALSRFHESQKARKNENSNGRNHEIVLSLNTSPLNDSQSPATPSFSLQRWARGQKEGGNAMFDLAEANRMLDTFVGSGATAFDITFIDIDGEKRDFRASQSARDVRDSLPKLSPGLTSRQQNIIVRPRSDKVTFVQLDDLTRQQVDALIPVACLTLETSPGNHQAWIAISRDGVSTEARHTIDSEKDFARHLRKGVGADLTASGATRVGGTFNFKRKYEPNLPMVKILHSAPGRIATPVQLEAMGIVAAPDPIHVAAMPFRASSVGRSWPDYGRCVLGAPPNRDKSGPDISKADYFFAMLAAQRGHSIEEIAARLLDISSKAKENGERYARITSENATAATERQRRSRA